MKEKSGLTAILQIVTIVLLCIIVFLLLLRPSGESSVSGNVERTLAEQKAMMEYKQSIGKQYITVSDDKISKSDYSVRIIGKITNMSNKKIYSASVHVSFYKNDTIIDSSSDYFDFIDPKCSRNFMTYAPDDFDTYTIDYTEGIIYD